jgi:hypothetical protein
MARWIPSRLVKKLLPVPPLPPPTAHIPSELWLSLILLPSYLDKIIKQNFKLNAPIFQ